MRDNSKKVFQEGGNVDWNAVKAIFSKTSKDSAKLNTGTTKRIFKQIYDQIAESTENNVAAGGSKPRKFFCASFVAYLLQASEADAAWRQMKEKNPELEKTLPNFSDPKIKKPVSKWAKNMAQQHGRELNDLIKNFRFDAKKTGPGALRAFFSHKKITSFSLEGS